MTERLREMAPWGWFKRLLVGPQGNAVEVTTQLSTLATVTTTQIQTLAGITSVAADLNLVSGMVAKTQGVKKVAKVALGVVTTGGGVFAWKNPEAVAIIVGRVTIDLTTAATGAGTVSVGKAANGTTSAANLLDTLDVHTATGVFDNLSAPGAGGKFLQRLATTDYITGSQASGAVAGLAGSAYIEYMLL